MAQQSTSTPRRRFLQILFGGSVAALSAATGFLVMRYLAPIAGEVISMLAGNVADLKEDGATKFLKVGTKDIMLSRSGQSITALDLKCSHAGCTVHWEAESKQFHCPCHGGTYAADGKVVKGPPPRPLSKLRVAVSSDGMITVTDLPA